MKLKLTDDDRKAIDLFLGEATAAMNSTSRGYIAASGAKNMKAVERVLNLLHALPAEEPSADLTARTLARIGQAPARIIDGAGTRAAIDPQPHRPA